VSRSRSARQLPKTEVEELVFKPLLSKKSMQIASKLGKARDRLLGNTSTSKIDELEAEYQREVERRKAATPKINKKSAYIDGRKGASPRHGGTPDRFEQLYAYNDKYRENKEALRFKKIDEEMQKDLLVSVKRPTTPKKTYKPQFYTADADIADRSEMWRSKNDEKRRKLQEAREAQELKACTFVPQVNKTNSTRYIKDMKESVCASEFAREGLYNHFTRIERAKREKSYQEMGRSRSRSAQRQREHKHLEHSVISQEEGQHEDSESDHNVQRSKISQTAPVGYINDSYASYNGTGSEMSQTDKGKSLVNILENLKKINQLM